MKVCYQCNKKYPDESNYCGQCGTELSDGSDSSFKYPIVFNNKDELIEFFSKLFIKYEKIRPSILGKLAPIKEK